MSRWPFGNLPAHRFQVIYADPPWQFATRTPAGKGKSPDRHYQTMTIAQMCALPVAELAAPNCALIMWIYDPMMPEAMTLMRAWGFKLKTRVFDWNKDTAAGEVPTGQGYFTRHGGEQVWLGTRGAPIRRDRSVKQYHREQAREHSRKPAEFARRIERLFDGPYLELFARTGRPGWSAWGDQIGRFGVER